MRKSDRLFQLTNLLRAHQPITARALAQRLAVSERTVYRYIDDLSVSGVPVYGEAGVGYRLTPGFELPPLQLTGGELEALVLAVNLATSRTSGQLAASARSLQSKIEAALPATLASEHARAPRTVRAPATPKATPPPYWETLHQTISQGTAVAMHYQALNGDISQRPIRPLGLFYWGNKWTLGSWCGLRQDYRDFRVDRILQLTPATLASPEHVSLDDYLKRL
ncbi:MAG: YafY family transcriptional regulator [Pseudomonadales bacterium]|nr:YafY family transcriptional regulator [Pseudomonadales bacterium]